MESVVLVNRLKLVGEIADSSRISVVELNTAMLEALNLNKPMVNIEGVEYREEWREILEWVN